MHCARKPHGLLKLVVELVKMTSGENGEMRKFHCGVILESDG